MKFSVPNILPVLAKTGEVVVPVSGIEVHQTSHENAGGLFGKRRLDSHDC